MTSIFKVGNQNIHCELINYQPLYEDKTLLVFLHEGLGSIGQWKDIPQKIADKTNLPALVYERAGHGISTSENNRRGIDYFENEAKITLDGLLTELHSVTKVILIGHSDGGSIALMYASFFPEKVQGVVSISAHAFTDSHTLERIKESVHQFEEGWLKTKLDKYHNYQTETMFYAWANMWNSPEFKTWNILNLLKSLTSPLLIVQGQKDEFTSTHQADQIEKAVSGKVTKLVLPHCGHHPHFEDKPLVVEEISGFIIDHCL